MFRFSLVLMMSLGLAMVPADADAAFKWLKRSRAQENKAEVVKQKKQPAKHARVERDVQRLESLLAGVKTSAKLSDKAWKSVTNEADMLAGRIYANVKSATTEKNAVRTAEQLRTHVQNMKKEALQGDYRSTRRHAAKALSAASRLDEWAG
jgi:hypothetical protein